MVEELKELTMERRKTKTEKTCSGMRPRQLGPGFRNRMPSLVQCLTRGLSYRLGGLVVRFPDVMTAGDSAGEERSSRLWGDDASGRHVVRPCHGPSQNGLQHHKLASHGKTTSSRGRNQQGTTSIGTENERPIRSIVLSDILTAVVSPRYRS